MPNSVSVSCLLGNNPSNVALRLRLMRGHVRPIVYNWRFPWVATLTRGDSVHDA